MTLESLYEGLNLQDYYMGKVTQVYRSCSIAQIDNLNLMADRNKFTTSFRPNTINYYVVIDSLAGLFLGEVFENKASRKNVFEMTDANDKPKDYHEISIDTIALMTPESDKFELAGFKTLGITDKVYLATDEIYQIFLRSLEFSHENEEPLPPFATFLSRSDASVTLKPSTLFNRHLMCIGLQTPVSPQRHLPSSISSSPQAEELSSLTLRASTETLSQVTRSRSSHSVSTLRSLLPRSRWSSGRSFSKLRAAARVRFLPRLSRHFVS